MRARILIAGAGAAAALTAGVLTAAGPAGAATAQCGNTPRCFGLISAQQAAPLELATAVPAARVHAGTSLIGLTPEGTAREDWHVGRTGTNRILRWAPHGISSHLCVTAVSDTAGSLPRLEPCVTGTAGSSHQVWQPVNIRAGGFRVYRNAADGLVLALRTADVSGGPVSLRAIGAGTGANKNFALSKPF